ncbi:GD19671 [Drosophila simulans]|uniref:GD19671 n=1 Tax=Drosophila simulans TaxID=7240 RepID=B4QVJ5_DROSI|nr:GD19671 [Drosophila simulans]
MVDSHVDVDQNSNMDIGTPSQPRQQHRLHSKQEQEPHRHHHQDSKAKQFPAGEEESHSSGETGENHWNDARSFSGHCHQLAEQLALDFNKTVVLWPCPRMKVSTSLV